MDWKKLLLGIGGGLLVANLLKKTGDTGTAKGASFIELSNIVNDGVDVDMTSQQSIERLAAIKNFILSTKREVNRQLARLPEPASIRVEAKDTEIATLWYLAAYARYYGVTNVQHFAYVLATCWVEANWVSQKEKRADVGTETYNRQENYWYSNYMGRGLVQITWLANYQKFKTFLGIDIVGNPDKVINTQIAAKIALKGMRDGSFTNKKLSDYSSGAGFNAYNARQIINSFDKAGLIRDWYDFFLSNMTYLNKMLEIPYTGPGSPGWILRDNSQWTI